MPNIESFAFEGPERRKRGGESIKLNPFTVAPDFNQVQHTPEAGLGQVEVGIAKLAEPGYQPQVSANEAWLKAGEQVFKTASQATHGLALVAKDQNDKAVKEAKAKIAEVENNPSLTPNEKAEKIAIIHASTDIWFDPARKAGLKKAYDLEHPDAVEDRIDNYMAYFLEGKKQQNLSKNPQFVMTPGDHKKWIEEGFEKIGYSDRLSWDPENPTRRRSKTELAYMDLDMDERKAEQASLSKTLVGLSLGEIEGTPMGTPIEEMPSEFVAAFHSGVSSGSSFDKVFDTTANLLPEELQRALTTDPSLRRDFREKAAHLYSSMKVKYKEVKNQSDIMRLQTSISLAVQEKQWDDIPLLIRRLNNQTMLPENKKQAILDTLTLMASSGFDDPTFPAYRGIPPAEFASLTPSNKEELVAVYIAQELGKRGGGQYPNSPLNLKAQTPSMGDILGVTPAGRLALPEKEAETLLAFTKVSIMAGFEKERTAAFARGLEESISSSENSFNQASTFSVQEMKSRIEHEATRLQNKFFNPNQLRKDAPDGAVSLIETGTLEEVIALYEPQEQKAFNEQYPPGSEKRAVVSKQFYDIQQKVQQMRGAITAREKANSAAELAQQTTQANFKTMLSRLVQKIGPDLVEGFQTGGKVLTVEEVTEGINKYRASQPGGEKTPKVTHAEVMVVFEEMEKLKREKEAVDKAIATAARELEGPGREGYLADPEKRGLVLLADGTAYSNGLHIILKDLQTAQGIPPEQQISFQGLNPTERKALIRKYKLNLPSPINEVDLQKDLAAPLQYNPDGSLHVNSKEIYDRMFVNMVLLLYGDNSTHDGAKKDLSQIVGVLKAGGFFTDGDINTEVQLRPDGRSLVLAALKDAIDYIDGHSGGREAILSTLNQETQDMISDLRKMDSLSFDQLRTKQNQLPNAAKLRAAYMNTYQAFITNEPRLEIYKWDLDVDDNPKHPISFYDSKGFNAEGAFRSRPIDKTAASFLAMVHRQTGGTTAPLTDEQKKATFKIAERRIQILAEKVGLDLSAYPLAEGGDETLQGSKRISIDGVMKEWSELKSEERLAVAVHILYFGKLPEDVGNDYTDKAEGFIRFMTGLTADGRELKETFHIDRLTGLLQRSRGSLRVEEGTIKFSYNFDNQISEETENYNTSAHQESSINSYLITGLPTGTSYWDSDKKEIVTDSPLAKGKAQEQLTSFLLSDYDPVNIEALLGLLGGPEGLGRSIEQLKEEIQSPYISSFKTFNNGDFLIAVAIKYGSRETIEYLQELLSNRNRPIEVRDGSFIITAQGLGPGGFPDDVEYSLDLSKITPLNQTAGANRVRRDATAIGYHSSTDAWYRQLRGRLHSVTHTNAGTGFGT